jgi:8-hydroxy-5-deazaflavin:NADPH oxidoreductase
LAIAGTPVVIGSRDAGRAAESAATLKERVPEAKVRGLENGEAARQGPIVLLCVPFRNQSENLTNLKGVLQPGQILVDATVPLAAAVSGRATRLLGVPQGSAGLQAAEMVPEGVQVVSALHTVSAATLNDLDAALDEDILVAGDSVDAKKRVAQLIARIDGLRPVNAGRLEASKLIEGLTPLLIGINSRYKTHTGVRITGLPDELW